MCTCIVNPCKRNKRKRQNEFNHTENTALRREQIVIGATVILPANTSYQLNSFIMAAPEA